MALRAGSHNFETDLAVLPYDHGNYSNRLTFTFHKDNFTETFVVGFTTKQVDMQANDIHGNEILRIS